MVTSRCRYFVTTSHLNINTSIQVIHALLQQGMYKTNRAKGPEKLIMKLYNNKSRKSSRRFTEPWFTQLMIEAIYESMIRGESEKASRLSQFIAQTPSGIVLFS